jgi:hypothetical protein
MPTHGLGTRDFSPNPAVSRDFPQAPATRSWDTAYGSVKLSMNLFD